ncbi:glycosyltransferase family 2 protein [Shinella zoogloeoides]|uniref:glycosyltransferase family 2 protein n=1 Tax=Shinella zoogloeoides TaxID=352475 RepID=UPI000E65A6F7|nr:glycosyltransferase family 2 protein [Shinella zoogloeoides]
MTGPLLSIISAVYNKAEVLPETLRLARAQRGIAEEDIEFVFVDDNSADGSLALLEEEAGRDSRVRIFASQENNGPAIAFNRAASQARGRYLLAIDADDMLPGNAAKFLIDSARRFDAALVFGRSRRGEDCRDVPEDAALSVESDPLAFVAERKIVRMGFLAERQLWLKAGGADETVFIQDQSLPLRLAAAADRLVFVDALVYHLRQAGDGNLSRNVLQQHHDRFFALLPFLDRPDASPTARRAVMRQMVSSLWKMDRDRGVQLPFLSAAGRCYLLNRMLGLEPSGRLLADVAARLKTLPGIRRPGGI